MRRIRFTTAYKQSLVSAPAKFPADDILNAIFAQDPVTGYPVNDLSIVLSDKSRPEVTEYIRTKLQQYIPSLPKTSLEEAEATAFLPGMTVQEYRENIREYLRGLDLKSEIVDDKKP